MRGAVRAVLIGLLLTITWQSGCEARLSNAEAIRALGQDLRSRYPSIRDRKVHWFLAVDVSKSMEASLTNTSYLVQDWLTYIVVPGDMVTAFVFNHALGKEKTWTVEDSKGDGQSPAFMLSLTQDIAVDKHAPGGSTVFEARRQLLALAFGTRDPTHDSTHVKLTLLMGDRDTPDSIVGDRVKPAQDDMATRMLTEFGADFEGQERAPQQVEVSSKYELVDGKPLLILSSISRKASAVEPGLSTSRLLPLDPPRIDTTPGYDPASGARFWLRWLPWLVFLGGAACIASVASATAGDVVLLDSKRVFPVNWRPWKIPEQSVRASLNAPGPCLQPLQKGLNDPIVLLVHPSSPLPWRPWTLNVKTPLPYRVLSSDGLSTERLTLAPWQEHPIRVQDDRGDVAAGRMEWRPAHLRRLFWRFGIGLVALSIVLGIIVPFVVQSLPLPEPATTREIKWESMFN